MSETAVEIRDLTLRVRGRPLLEDASLHVERGEVVLLVGLSGSGKSLTLRLLLGLLDARDPAFDISGDVELFGEPARVAARRRAGIVFQDFGLFDELTAADNVRFGRDHCTRDARAGARESVDALLEELGLDGDARVVTLSGGMKQRAAIARTLAYDPDVVFYDEPTSGLDPAMSTQVAQRIRSTNDQHGKTSFVVTHDLTALAGIADRIVLLDPRARKFREVAAAEIDGVLADLRTARPQPAGPGAHRSGIVSRFFEATGAAVEAAARSVLAVVPRWPRPAWGLRYLVYYLRLATIGSALAYVAVCGFILGLIVTWFTFSFLPFKQYTEPLLIDRVLGAIGFALYRIMVPGMVAMLVAARSGAAVAADIGNRVYSRQTDALRSLGVAPDRYLLTNVVLAHLIGMPILIAVNFLAARWGSLLVFAAVHGDHSPFFWQAEFDRFLDGGGRVWDGTGWLLGKSLVSAVGVAAIAYHLGARPKGSGREIAAAVTQTIIWATVFVLLVQLAAALMEFEPI